MDQFAACWGELDDPQTGNAALRGFNELLVIAFCAVPCGGQGAAAMALFAKAKEPYLRGFLNLANGLPSHDTPERSDPGKGSRRVAEGSRLFRRLDPDRFRAVFRRFMARFSGQCQGVIAIDGKLLRRSFDSASGKSALPMAGAWARSLLDRIAPEGKQAIRPRAEGCEQRLVLAQIATDAKSNEIAAVPKRLEMLSPKGAIVSADALNCRRATAQQIVKQGGGHALALKGNQGKPHADPREILDGDGASCTGR